MDEVIDGVIIGVGVNLTLMGAELTASYVFGNALHSRPSVGGYATGKNRLQMV